MKVRTIVLETKLSQRDTAQITARKTTSFIYFCSPAHHRTFVCRPFWVGLEIKTTAPSIVCVGAQCSRTSSTSAEAWSTAAQRAARRMLGYPQLSWILWAARSVSSLTFICPGCLMLRPCCPEQTTVGFERRFYLKLGGRFWIMTECVFAFILFRFLFLKKHFSICMQLNMWCHFVKIFLMLKNGGTLFFYKEQVWCHSVLSLI